MSLYISIFNKESFTQEEINQIKETCDKVMIYPSLIEEKNFEEEKIYELYLSVIDVHFGFYYDLIYRLIEFSESIYQYLHREIEICADIKELLDSKDLYTNSIEKEEVFGIFITFKSNIKNQYFYKSKICTLYFNIDQETWRSQEGNDKYHFYKRDYDKRGFDLDMSFLSTYQLSQFQKYSIYTTLRYEFTQFVETFDWERYGFDNYYNFGLMIRNIIIKDDNDYWFLDKLILVIDKIYGIIIEKDVDIIVDDMESGPDVEIYNKDKNSELWGILFTNNPDRDKYIYYQSDKFKVVYRRRKEFDNPFKAIYLE